MRRRFAQLWLTEFLLFPTAKRGLLVGSSGLAGAFLSAKCFPVFLWARAMGGALKGCFRLSLFFNTVSSKGDSWEDGSVSLIRYLATHEQVC